MSTEAPDETRLPHSRGWETALRLRERLQQWLASSLPARAVMKRELVSGLRNPRPYAFLGLFMLVMILGLFFLVAVAYDRALSRTGGIPASTVRELFMLLGLALYIGGALLIPPLAGASICIEKQQDSYDLLLMTYIRPLSLAFAKLSNVLGLYFLVVVASLPFIGVFFFLVGIDWTQFFVSFFLIFMSALSLAIIGLLCSAWCYRTLPAIITTYVVGTLLHGGALFALVITTQIVARRSWLMDALNKMDENLIAALIPGPGLVLVAQSRGDWSILAYTVVYHGVIAIVGLLLTLAILRRPVRTINVDTEKPIDDQAELKARRRKFPYYLLDPRRRRPMIPDRQNPVLAKELQTGLLNRGAFAIRVIYGFTLVSFIVTLFTIYSYAYSGNPEAMAAYTYFFDTILILVLTPTLVATTMAKEWEWQNVDSLRITLLPAETILAGKFQAAFRVAMLPVLGSVLGSIALPLFGYDSFEFWRISAMCLVTMVVCVLYALALSFWSAIGQRRTLSALLMAYGTGIALIALLPIAALMLFIAADTNNSISDIDVARLFFLSPVYAYYACLEGIGNLDAPGAMARYWLLNCAVFLTASAGLVALARRRFIRGLRRERP